MVGKKEICQYTHSDKKRPNNPPAGLVTPGTDPANDAVTYKHNPRLSPYLIWSGKHEKEEFRVETVSLHVHELMDPLTIIEKAVRSDQNMQSNITHWFETPDNILPLRDAIEFYKHDQGWSNRLIAGDSLLVMNSLLEKEGMEGKVKMIYFDPPYGVDFGSNYQVQVGKPNVKENDVAEEPETIKAFRDTWKLGIHSYLTYLKDRLELAKRMLADGGSIFLQISQDNVHHVREVLDEVFGPTNFYANIIYVKTSRKGTDRLDSINDYILWYTKGEIAEYRQLFTKKTSYDRYQYVEEANGTRRKITGKNDEGVGTSKRYLLDDPTSQTPNSTTDFEFEFEGTKYNPGSRGWRTNLEGMKTLAKKNRLIGKTDLLWYVRYFNDFPYIEINNVWTDTQSSFAKKVYIVQTNVKAIERCMLMATKPGDLVFDPTGGSGTTAYVAEKLGRRWITCDTSRVATAVARQRLLTSVFEYYELANPALGVKGEFKYATVPRITLKSVATNSPPQDVVLWDKPRSVKKSRVAGPFTVEAVPSPTVTEIEPCRQSNDQPASTDIVPASSTPSRHEKWRHELQSSGIRGKSNQKITFIEVKQIQGTKWLHADAEIKEENPQRAVISFGPEHAPLGRRQVALAMEEAQRLIPTPKMIIFAAMQFDPEASKEIDGLDWPNVTILKAEMNKDLLTSDLKKSKSGSETFWLVGQPDISLDKNGDYYTVSVNGFDYYNGDTDKIESAESDKVAMWELDTDYDGRSVYPQQVFFPMSGKVGDWEKLAKTLKARIDLKLIGMYKGTKSMPFKAGSYKRAAIKIIDARGVESIKVVDL